MDERVFGRLMPAVLAVTLCTIWLAAAAPVSASLIPGDLRAPGDGLLTIDTATGYEWLDLTATNGVSYANVLGGFGDYIYAGTGSFHFATEEEILSLYSSAGLTPLGVSSATNVTSIEELWALMGQTYSDGESGGTNWAAGWIAGTVPDRVGYAAARITWWTSPDVDSEGWAYIASNVDYAEFAGEDPGYGSYLVRRAEPSEPVPEPGTILLLGGGVAVLGIVRLVRGKRSLIDSKTP